MVLFKKEKRNLLPAVLACIILTITVFADFSFFIHSANAAESEKEYFTILHTNDIHARVNRFPRLAGAVNEIRKSKEAVGEPVLLTDGGDFISPYIYTWLNAMGCAPELKMMQNVGYDVITFGNHEFDLGSRGLARLIKNAGYPDADMKPVIIATNTVPPQGHPLAETGLFERTHIKELSNGLKIGFIGLHGRGTIGMDLFKSGPVKFPNPYETAREAVAELNADGVDLVIALIHDSFRNNVAFAAEVSGIDIILGGHNHVTFEPAFENDTIIIQTSSYLEHLCILELAYNRFDGRLELRNSETGKPYHIPLNDSIKEDDSIAAAVAYFDDKLDETAKELTGGRFQSLTETVARTPFPLTSNPLQESNMGNFSTDAIRLVASDKLGERVDFALLPSGLCWKNLDSGNLSFKDLADIPLTGTGPDLLPGHPLVSFYLEGEEVRRILEVLYFISLSDFRGDEEYPQISGLRLDYNPDRTVIFNIPFKVIDLFGERTPVPSLRTVINAERYTGDGPQTLNDKDYVPLKWGDKQLYRVVTESYLLYHLPTLESVLHLLPMLEIVPKDRDGNLVRYMDDEGDIAAEVVVYDQEGNEVKTWQALVEYAAMQPTGADGLPEIPPYYADTMGRINTVWTVPFYVWFILTIVIIWAIIVFIRRMTKRRKHAHT